MATVLAQTHGNLPTRAECHGCSLLGKDCVPGYGNRKSPPIMFVAEAPGENEVTEDIPLVGRAGSFLRRVVDDLGLDNAECYYTNICICRPDNNRTPTADEAKHCFRRLIREIKAVNPKLVVVMGNTSAHTLGKFTRGISTVRGKYKKFASNASMGLLATYHPSAVLRDPDKYRDFLEDLSRAIRIAVEGEAPVVPPPTDNYRMVTTQAQFDWLISKLSQAKVIAVDLETRSKNFLADEILCAGFSWKRETAASLDWNLIRNSKSNRRKLKEVLETIPGSYQNGSFDVPFLWTQGIEPRYSFDPEIAHWLLDERQGGHSLEAMATQYYRATDYKGKFRRKWGLGRYIADEELFGRLFAAIPLDDMMLYNATDADYTYRLTIDLAKECRAQNLLKLHKLLLRATLIFGELKRDGMLVDQKYLVKLETKFTRQIEKAKELLDKYAPDVNVNSPKQLAVYLYDVLKLKPFGDTKPDGRSIPEDVISAELVTVSDPDARDYWQSARIGLYQGGSTAAAGRGLSSRSTGTFMLYWLAQQHEYPRMLINLKRARKRLRTYCKTVRDHMGTDGRLRPDYRLAGTTAGRFKTGTPSVHQIPNGPEIYNLYMADPGWVILHADYKQADMRMMVHLTGDEKLIEWLRGDPHTAVVQDITGYSDAEMAALSPADLKRRRMAAKMLNFGIPYGRSAKNVAPQLGITVKAAARYIKQYWQRLPTLKKWIDGREALIRRDQEVVSPFGNKRRFPLIIGREHSKTCGRLAVVFPIMASVNYITTVAQINSIDALREAGIPVKVWPHIHDSFNLLVPINRWRKAVTIMAKVMEDAPKVSVDIDTYFPPEITAGVRWGDCQNTAVYDGGWTPVSKTSIENKWFD